MSLYDREYMRDGRTEFVPTRRPEWSSEYRRVRSPRPGRGEQVGFVLAAVGVIALLLGIAFL